jgi:hypothetical protein
MKASSDVMERIGELADKADNFFHGPRVQPRLEADCMRHGMLQIRDELRAIFIEVTGDNPWNSDTTAGGNT